jgi:anti-sigma B factor antagonist
MEIIKTQEDNKLTVALEGRLDTVTSPQLEGELRTAVNGISELIFDMAKLDYVSSAGLRVLLSAQKVMNRQGSMTIRNVKPEIMEIFEVTGFSEILIIEE